MKRENLSFMMDSGNTDHKELIIDYMLSWTLRMSCVEDDGYDNMVQEYCTKILSKMVFEDIKEVNKSYKSIQSIKTWKQWKKIDLCVEIEFIDKEEKVSKHALLIENKAYSCLHSDQLNRYRKIFEDEYKGTEFENNLHYVFFTIHERANILLDEITCREANFLCLTMDEIRECLWAKPEDLVPTGNEIFDEFWIKNWG